MAEGTLRKIFAYRRRNLDMNALDATSYTRREAINQ